MNGFRIVTINTGKGDGPYRQRMRLLVEQLAALSPDVVACQESFGSEEACADTAELVAGELGLHLFLSQARKKERVFEGRGVLSGSGMALLSRTPWQATFRIELPSDPRDGDRVAQVGRLDIDGRAVTVANVHLTHLREADRLRSCQLSTVLAHTDVAHAKGPVIVCGDFNSRPDGAVLGPLLAGSCSHIDVRDTWALGGGEGSGGTLVARGSQGPCVDYILSVVREGQPHPRFVASALALNVPDATGLVFPSDHFAITTVLCLDETANGDQDD